MVAVGVTGGIGSGKSLVCEIFKIIGIPVFNADLESKKLLDTKQVIDFYYKEFGETVFSNEKLDKQKISQLIFSDKNALQKVNSFVHPLVKELFQNWSKTQDEVPYIIEEAALLFENNSYSELNFNILVCAPIETRISRIINRDNLSREAIIRRINNQLSDNEKRKLANYIIENDDSTMVVPQVLLIHNSIIQKIK